MVSNGRPGVHMDEVLILLADRRTSCDQGVCEGLCMSLYACLCRFGSQQDQNVARRILKTDRVVRLPHRAAIFVSRWIMCRKSLVLQGLTVPS